MIDRPIRPLFPDGYRNDTQVIVTVLSHDLENDPDILAMVAASTALTLSGVPFMGPVGGARVGLINGTLKLNPTIEEMKLSELDLVVAGTQDAVLMVESEAKELSEQMMLEAVMTGHRGFQPVIDAIIRLAERAAKDPRDLVLPDLTEVSAAVAKIAEAELREAYKITVKQDRYAAVDAVKSKVTAALFPEGAEPKFSKESVGEVFKELQAKVVRWNVLDTGVRIDGRDVKTVRPIVADVGVLPRTHGSALFTRGETQALVVATPVQARMNNSSTRSRARIKNVSYCIIIFHPSRLVKLVVWDLPAVVKLAMVNLPGARLDPCCPQLVNFHTRCASF